MQRHGLVDRLWRTRGRQQRDLPTQHRGTERDQECVTVFAQIDHRASRRQCRGNLLHVSEKLSRAHRGAMTPRQHAVRVVPAQQRQLPWFGA